MAERVTYHVVPGKNGGWDVKQENSGKTMGTLRSKTQAILLGRDLAKMHEYSLLVIHGREGQVETQYNYGRHPSLGSNFKQ